MIMIDHQSAIILISNSESASCDFRCRAAASSRRSAWLGDPWASQGASCGKGGSAGGQGVAGAQLVPKVVASSMPSSWNFHHEGRSQSMPSPPIFATASLHSKGCLRSRVQLRLLSLAQLFTMFKARWEVESFISLIESKPTLHCPPSAIPVPNTV